MTSAHRLLLPAWLVVHATGGANGALAVATTGHRMVAKSRTCHPAHLLLINHYSNTYGGAHGTRAARAPIDALRAYIARMFPKLASLDEAHRIVVDITTRYETLARATATAAKPSTSPNVRTAA
jgi:hypothetical protein